MAYYSNYSDAVNKGKIAEQTLAKTAKKNGFKVAKSTTNQDKYRHIDFTLTRDTVITVDVKNVGSIGFTSELVNNWGYPGSLFGDADYIAYVDLFNRKIYLVQRTAIIDLLVSKGVINANGEPLHPIYHPSNNKYEYVLYNRPEWKDLWIVLNNSDIVAIAGLTWEI